MCGATAQLSASVPGKGGREGGQEGDGETERNGRRSCFLLRTALWRNYTTAGRIIMALSAYDLFIFYIVRVLHTGQRMLLAQQEYRGAAEQACTLKARPAFLQHVLSTAVCQTSQSSSQG